MCGPPAIIQAAMFGSMSTSVRAGAGVALIIANILMIVNIDRYR